METETLDKLYLEWSQFTKARNKREIEARYAIKQALYHIRHNMSDEKATVYITELLEQVLKDNDV